MLPIVCIECVWKVLVGCLESTSRVSGRRMEGVSLTIIGGGLEGVWKVSGRCLKPVWKVSGRPRWTCLAPFGLGINLLMSECCL